jgi:tetratricopeptide (TPR) repeat protein
LAAHPKDPDLLNDVGMCHYNRREWTEAEKYFRQTVELNPQHQCAWINLGLTLGFEQRYPEAMDAFHKVQGAAEAECNIGFIYFTQGKHAEAKAAYYRALAADPQSQLALGALRALDKADESKPSIPVADVR